MFPSPAGNSPSAFSACRRPSCPRPEGKTLVQRRGLAGTLEILLAALRLGLTSFGGPVAHLAYFREEYVARRRWLDDRTYAGLVALCQFLPGPASSQVGIAVGMMRGGFLGGFLAWLGFTLPSALLMALFALYLQDYDVTGEGWLRGLLITAVAVVAHAVWDMAGRLAPDRERASIAVLAAVAALAAPSPWVQVLLMAAGGTAGRLLLRHRTPPADEPDAPCPVDRRTGILAWALFLGFLVGLPLLRRVYPADWVAVADAFYRTGSLVFGGGHVVLPLLAGQVIGPGWITEAQFLAGYGAAQAVPGPLFTFAAFAGAAMGGWFLGAVALISVFAPSFLLVTAALPYWDTLRRRPAFRAALDGVNAVVVGLLLAAFYDPIWTKAIRTPADFSLALIGFSLLRYWKAPAWAVVLLLAAAASR
ncbi:MAG: ChrA protein [Bacillota bacterium]|nr:MAG: ChrA protein [Bacillota bacterium]